MRLLWRMIGLLRLLTYKLARAVVGRSLFFFFKQKTAYEMRISDWSSTCALPILASHILIQVEPGADAAAQKAAEEKAAAIAAEARKPGADFAALAREDSDDTGSKDSGGDLGWIAHDGGMVQPFEDALFAMQPGDVSEPVKTDFGWPVIKLREVRSGQQTSFEEARAQLEGEQAEVARERAFNELTGKLVDPIGSASVRERVGPYEETWGVAVEFKRKWLRTRKHRR